MMEEEHLSLADVSWENSFTVALSVPVLQLSPVYMRCYNSWGSENEFCQCFTPLQDCIFNMKSNSGMFTNANWKGRYTERAQSENWFWIWEAYRSDVHHSCAGSLALSGGTSTNLSLRPSPSVSINIPHVLYLPIFYWQWFIIHVKVY